MSDRATLIQSLRDHKAQPGREELSRTRMISFVESEADCFLRTHLAGHVTGSALVVSVDGQRVLLNHHKFLNIWICFGGHADGESDILNVALREACEETGKTDITPVMSSIFDLDIHAIPDNSKKNEPPHEHFDICYLLRATANDDFILSPESLDIKWCGYDEALDICKDDSRMIRMLNKWQCLT